MEKGGYLKTKRLTIRICVFAMLLSCFCFTAGAAGTVSLELQIPESLPAAGERFEVKLLVTENPGICTAQVILSYNRAALKCVEVNEGELLDSMLSVSNPNAKDGVRIGGATAAPVTETGELASFVFEVLIPGEANFSLAGSKMGDDASYHSIAVKQIFTGAETEEPAGEAEDEPTQPVDEPEDEPENPIEEIEDEPEAQDEAILFRFPDVAETHWAAKEIRRAAELGLVNGRSDGSFDPGGKMTRAELVTVLWRMAGQPEPAKAAEFPDVSPENWYYDAVSWASAQEIVKGTDKGFEPNGSVTREQIAVILFRMNGEESGMELMFGGIYDSTYQDSAEISSWAKPGVYWSVYKGLIKGTAETTLSPKKTATRAEVVTLLLRYMDKFI